MKITSIEMLRQLYPPASGRAAVKTLTALEYHSRRFIERSPFVLLATVDGHDRLDCSPRGGEPGFVKIIDDGRIIIPDSKGNNRLDSLTNIIETGQIGCLFLLPGMDETLRLNGHATVNISPDYLAWYQDQRNPPKCVIDIEITEVFLHCAKSLMRSKLWDSSQHIDRTSFATMGQMLKDQLNDDGEVETQEQMIHRYRAQL